MLPEDLLEDWLGLTDAGDIALAEDAADRALAWIQAQSGRYFGTPTEFVIRAHRDRRTYWLPEIPNNVEGESDDVYAFEVHEKNSAGEWELVEDTDYELIPPDMDRLYEMPTVEFEDVPCPTWPRSRKTLRFTFTAGYANGSLPGDIQQLVLDMVKAWWGDRTTGGLKSESIDGYSYERWISGDGARFAEDWKATLTKWRHPVLGRW